MPGYELIDIKEQNAINSIFVNNGGVLFQHGFDKLRNNHYEVREFEKKIAEYFGSKFALAVSSGTAALKIALKCAKINNKHDEIITQAHNFISDVEVIIDINATPVIINIDKSLNMDIQELKEKINEKTKAVIVSDMLGNGSYIEEIEKICRDKNILLIDDACEIIGGKYKNKYYGTFGDIGVFSLDFGKNITCGEGGIIFTDNEKYYYIMKQYFDHGHMNNPNFTRGLDDFAKPGFNYRMTEMQGAIAKVQLDKLNFILEENKKRYTVFENTLLNFEKRHVYNNVELSYDTFIFFVDNYILRKLIIDYIKSIEFGTKNLPDAMRWHCAYYWDHMLDVKQRENLIKTQKILSNSIAIPILLKKNITFYEDLANNINQIYDKFIKNQYTLTIDYLGIIPARSGSKGILNKNIIKLSNNKSLLEIIAQKADDSKLLDAVILTTDSEFYKNIYKEYNITKDITFEYLRPSEISQDNSTTYEYITDILKYLKTKNIFVKNIIILQATSPLYNKNDIDNIIIEHKKNQVLPIISVCEPIQHPNDMVLINNKNELLYEHISNRQNYNKSYFINGCFYISSVSQFMQNKTFFIKDTKLYNMDIESGIDIDNHFHLRIVNKMLSEEQ
jgi:8-amino-3,8-dideoxy-alpha-D-manno-octulosonate transaminase